MADIECPTNAVNLNKTNRKRPKEGYNFLDHEVELLIYEWSKREVLLNSKHINYFKKDSRMTAVNQMVEELKFPGALLLINSIIIYMSKIQRAKHMYSLPS